MGGDPAVSALGMVGALGTASGAWPDELWAGSVGIVDALLRTWYGVYEFTDDPLCVFRIGVSRARAAISLSDGTAIAADEVIGTLHFWNEHLPRYPASGPDLRWACTMRDQVAHSQCLLAAHIEKDPAWHEVKAFHGEGMFFSGRLGMPQVERVCMRFGYEQVPGEPVPSLRRRVHMFCENFTLWGITRAFQPAALPRRPFLRPRQELWLSRFRLLDFARRHAELQARTARSRVL
ncbi:MAG: YkoP family protein [Stellaceae bacterium]